MEVAEFPQQGVKKQYLQFGNETIWGNQDCWDHKELHRE